MWQGLWGGGKGCGKGFKNPCHPANPLVISIYSGGKGWQGFKLKPTCAYMRACVHAHAHDSRFAHEPLPTLATPENPRHDCIVAGKGC
jgi:uncharacterized protein (DUF1499 family)